MSRTPTVLSHDSFQKRLSVRMPGHKSMRYPGGQIMKSPNWEVSPKRNWIKWIVMKVRSPSPETARLRVLVKGFRVMRLDQDCCSLLSHVRFNPTKTCSVAQR